MRRIPQVRTLRVSASAAGADGCDGPWPKRMRVAFVLALQALWWTGCVVVPVHSVRHAPRGTVEIVDARTRAPIDSALVLVLTMRGQGPFDNVKWNERRITGAYIWGPGERVFLHEGNALRTLTFWKENATQALILVAPGYAPKFLLASSSKVRKGDKLIWALRSITGADSANTLEELRRQLQGKELGRSVLEKWDSGYSWSSGEQLPKDHMTLGVNPAWNVMVELDDRDMRCVDEYLARAIDFLRDRGGIGELRDSCT